MGKYESGTKINGGKAAAPKVQKRKKPRETTPQKGKKRLPKWAVPAITAFLVTVIAALAIYLTTPPAQVMRDPPTIPTTTDPVNSGATTSPGYTTSSDENSQPQEVPLVRKAAGTFYTFALLGTHDDYNTDTIMLASLDLSGDSPKVDIISIPRDSQLDVSWDLKKINSVYGVNKGGDAGAQAFMEKLESICGVYPDFYAVVNIKSFTKVVDLVDGVPFYIPYDMYHDKPDSDPDKQYAIDIKKGQHTLNSEQALAVVRYRGTGRSDFGRMDIQKDFLLALLKRVKSKFTLDKIPGLFEIVVQSVRTNMPLKDMIWFYTKIADINMEEDIAMHTMPNLGPGKYKGQDYVYLDREGVAQLVNQTVNPFTTDIDPASLVGITLHGYEPAGD